MKWFGVFLLFVIALCAPWTAKAMETSSDPMLLEWSTEKVWTSNGELFVSGEFENKAHDITIKRLEKFVMYITFAKSDGSRYTVQVKPNSLPILRIPARRSREVTFNMGNFEGNWKSWTTDEEYTFSYVRGRK